jgi:TRAP-type uncharacterized transport system substrate-binding protein
MWAALGKKKSDLKWAAQMKPSATHGALCDNKIDAFFWLAGNPAALNKEAATSCDVTFVKVEGALIDKLVADNSFYTKTPIPG